MTRFRIASELNGIRGRDNRPRKGLAKKNVDITNLFVHERMAEPESNMSANIVVCKDRLTTTVPSPSVGKCE